MQEKKEDAAVERKKEEVKEGEEEAKEIVLKVDMHCEACARKVARALKGFQGFFTPSICTKSSFLFFITTCH